MNTLFPPHLKTAVEGVASVGKTKSENSKEGN